MRVAIVHKRALLGACAKTAKAPQTRRPIIRKAPRHGPAPRADTGAMLSSSPHPGRHCHRVVLAPKSAAATHTKTIQPPGAGVERKPLTMEEQKERKGTTGVAVSKGEQKGVSHRPMSDSILSSSAIPPRSRDPRLNSRETKVARQCSTDFGQRICPRS